jgi:glycosyltransferase involved in cell wall biosynthesis
MNKAENNIKVSVCVVTYNHEKYINRCIQSIIDQKTNFDFEIIIGDDCSTDQTRDIIINFQKKYPKIIKPIFQSKNIGASKNYKTVHLAATGDYISHIDGDDYFYAGKLQAQVNFLDENLDCSMSVHKLETINKYGHLRSVIKDNPTKFNQIYLLQNHPCFLASSMMYRRCFGHEIQSLSDTFIDLHVYILLAKKGKIGCINRNLGYYTSNIGVSSNRQLMPYIQDALTFFQTKFPEVSDAIVNRCRSRQYLSYSIAALTDNNISEFKNHLSCALQADQSWILPKIFKKISIFGNSLRFIVLFYKKNK